MSGGIHHRDGWIVVQAGKPITDLIRTRQQARVFAWNRNRNATVRCVVYPARQITVWKPEKAKGAKP